MPQPTLHFIGNDCSAPQQVVQWCLKQWPKTLPPGLVFCVPTALAMRRLRDALVRAYSVFQGVRFTQPAGLTAYFEQPNVTAIATEAERLCVWGRVFQWLATVDQENLILKWLFPGKNAWLERPAARYALAQRFLKLRATLAEVCLDFGGVKDHPQTKLLDAREQHRWEALDLLETKYREELATLQLTDPADIQLDILRDPRPKPLESEPNWRLIVACVPDMMPAVAHLFEAAPQCDILVQSSQCEANAFTAFGTPNPTYWEARQLNLPQSSILQAESPMDEAASVEQFLGQSGTINPKHICLGILNHEIMPYLSSSFETHGIRIFEPDPIRLSMQPAVRLLRALFRLAETGRLDFLLSALTVAELPTLVGSDYATLRSYFVDLIDEHRPATLREALPFIEKGSIYETLVNQIQAWCHGLTQSPCNGAIQVLVDLFGSQFLDPVKDALLFSTFETLQQLFTEIESVRVPAAEKHEALLMARIDQTALHPIRGTNESSYEGRFEILWSDAQHFAVAGLNEGLFPDTTFEDAFLPNQFRKDLGLRSDVTRIARDAYILDTLCDRVPASQLLLTCCKQSSRGDWMKPSRLFFHCTPEEQSERAETFFLTPAAHLLPKGDLSKLSFATTPADWVKHLRIPTRFSPSAIATFLRAPILYWMQYHQHLNETVPLTEGVQANVFGTLVHEALEELPKLTHADPELLTKGLEAAFDKAFFKRYGTQPDIERLALRHAAHKRLRQAVFVELESRRDGWKTKYTELDTRNGAWEVPLDINGTLVTLYGRIDRVDHNEQTGVWRVIDYKTGAADKDHEPNKVHYTQVEDETQWHNFQLPIYRLLLRHALNLPDDAPVEMAYFHLPPKGETKITLMKDPQSEAHTLEDLKAVLHQMVTLSEETLLQNYDSLSDSLLKHLLSSCQNPNDANN